MLLLGTDLPCIITRGPLAYRWAFTLPSPTCVTVRYAQVWYACTSDCFRLLKSLLLVHF